MSISVKNKQTEAASTTSNGTSLELASKKKKKRTLVDRLYVALREHNAPKNTKPPSKRTITIEKEPQKLPSPPVPVSKSDLPKLPAAPSVLTLPLASMQATAPPILPSSVALPSPTPSSSSVSAPPQKKTVSNKKKGGSLAEILCQRMKERERGRRLDHAGAQAQKLPQLRTPITGLRCFTTFECSDHDMLVQKYFNPLMCPPQSVAHLLTPLRSFAKKIPKTDPKFTFFIVPRIKSEDTAGLCSSKMKRIHLMHSSSEPSSETVLHELCHFAVCKMGWKGDDKRSFIRRINKEIAEDINALSASDWKTCDKIIKMKLFSVQAHYEKQKHWDEYIARVPQIISRMANAHPQESYSQIEARLKKDIPHLFKIYKEEFLPQLCAYVAKSNGVVIQKE